RLHRQEEFTKTASSTNTSQKLEESLLVTSQSFDILTSSAKDLTTSFSASNILLNLEQERQNIEQSVEQRIEEIEKEIEQEQLENYSRKKFKETNLNYSSFED
ncbi:8521_t:CDS:1, partial [Racocetra persica]